MNIERISLTDSTLLLEQLRGCVFHLTTLVAYAGIQAAGEISNNKSGHFPINTSSENSYGRLHGYVCLFDLRDDTPEKIQKALDCYYFIGPNWFSKHGRKFITWDLVYLFMYPQYYDQLIPSTRVHDHYRETGKYLQAIPDSEVWIENSIPLSWIRKALFVTIKESIFYPGLSSMG
jgi:hypothetical protein